MNLQDYLNKRKLSKEVQKYSNITYNGDKIVIPVYSEEGEFLFNKYRKNPLDTNPRNPKYSYDKGSKFTVYGYFPNKSMSKDSIVFTEGEFDTLVLQSYGINAITSTGGCSSFKSEWVKDFKQVIICLDGDEAGYKSSAKIAVELNRNIKIIIIPQGKDVSDFFISGKTLDDFNSLPYLLYKPFNPLEPTSTFTSCKYVAGQVIKLHNGKEIVVNEILKLLDKKYFELLKENKCYDFVEKKIQELLTQRTTAKDNQLKGIDHRLKKYYRVRKPRRYNNDISTDKWVSKDTITQANSFPIDNLIEFNSDNKTLCLWHDEDTPSLAYNKEGNYVRCFGKCGKKFSCIDTYMKIHGVDFVTAVKDLSK